MVVFSRKIEIYEIQNFNKISSFTISFLLFYHFWHCFFSISPIQTCQKMMAFFVVFYSKEQRFYQRIPEISKSFFTKIQIFLSKFCGLLFVFLLFYYFLHFLFNFVYVFVKKFLKFLCFLILWIRDFNKDFWKIMEHFTKKYRHLKSKILQKFHYLLFVFYLFLFLAFLTSFFSYFT